MTFDKIVPDYLFICFLRGKPTNDTCDRWTARYPVSPDAEMTMPEPTGLSN
ncbi:hypothetical protein SXCC_00539 [Gluconacetobacter sp. SXCC-1]|nr:hypothetical protein SXCC_00539 [Gluconacetobacter sp. SXCC-1]